tara:strand:- start:9341 stop:10489 length:1149 start_codon:yes stop_codon:yes gene_type:complete
MANTKILTPDLIDLTAVNNSAGTVLPKGLTAGRPSSPSNGEFRYNTTNKLIEFYDGVQWVELSDTIYADNFFNTVLYGGTGSAQSITGAGFQPDFVWTKNYLATASHYLFDSVRGVGKEIYSDLTAVEYTDSTTVTSFDSDGFSVGTGTGVNNSSNSYVAWQWKAGGAAVSNPNGSTSSTISVNTDSQFSIVKSSSAANFLELGHGLNGRPDMIFVKSLTSTAYWMVYHSAIGEGRRLKLNDTDAATADTYAFPKVTNTTFNFNISSSNQEYICYCWKAVTGYSAFGFYTGNGSTTGPVVTTGFEPAWVLIKNTAVVSDWAIFDDKRNTSNPRDTALWPNDNLQQGTYTYGINFTDTGFEVIDSDSDLNGSGNQIVYMAFAK